jgi:adenylate cyclase
MSEHAANLSGPYALMFADMANSSKLYDALGNTLAVDLVSQCIALLVRVTMLNKGRVIKTIGDEVMCVFPDVEQAALAASEMQHAVHALDNDPSVTPHGLQACVGLHFGVVLDEGDDVFGDAVNTAARIAGLCKAGQILATEQFVDALPVEFRNTVRFFDEVELRGKQELFTVYELLWEFSDLTEASRQSRRPARTEHSRCTLRFGDAVLEMGGDLVLVNMGRADDVELQCRGALTSRKHARIEFRRGRFILTDQSANGTFVRPDGDKVQMLRRDYFNLNGSGRIGLGETPVDDYPLSIFYRCE